MRNPYKKFQKMSMHGSKAMLCIKKRDKRTEGRKEGRTNAPEAICPSYFFEVRGIRRVSTLLHTRPNHMSRNVRKRTFCRVSNEDSKHAHPRTDQTLRRSHGETLFPWLSKILPGRCRSDCAKAQADITKTCLFKYTENFTTKK